ncbi:hypothetical protein SAMN02787081_00480 [Lysinibacillus fusiformis]|nr:hypothetical protein SAMN02787081_00480 [Lysinibacillus fusiformis]SEM86885.1 hypothetical protein SAMN02787103_00480 [Lysinibacillus fusiformis]
MSRSIRHFSFSIRHSLRFPHFASPPAPSSCVSITFHSLSVTFSVLSVTFLPLSVTLCDSLIFASPPAPSSCVSITFHSLSVTFSVLSVTFLPLSVTLDVPLTLPHHLPTKNYNSVWLNCSSFLFHDPILSMFLCSVCF